MSKAKDEAAFPQAEGITVDTNSFVKLAGGLTKRELFAAMAMQGLLASNVIQTSDMTTESVCKWSRCAADLLLEALEAK